ncbi:MAG: RNA 2'-phosphotransferase [Chitinophagales bacterium]
MNYTKFNYTRLSKTLSKILRHRPEQFGIQLDPEGWTSLEELIGRLQRQQKWKDLTEQDILDMMAASEKQRYEVKDGKIRAFYGHSIDKKITKTTSVPPEILYHGTPRATVPLIEESGLLSMNRQYVHLSADIQTAMVVGKRRDIQPTILKVKALEAHQNGIDFYLENNGIWLSEPIPPRFIVFAE